MADASGSYAVQHLPEWMAKSSFDFAAWRKLWTERNPRNDRADLARLVMFVENARLIEHEGIPGSLAELGVYRGTTAKLLHALFPGRTLWLFDTFEGFDPRDLAAAGIGPVVSAAEIHAAQRAAASVTVSDDVLGYVVDLAQATRRSPSVQLGVSPRATTALLAAAKAWAWLGGYPAITPDHVQTMLVPTWRHRLRLRPDAELEGVSVDAVLGSVLQQTRVPI